MILMNHKHLKKSVSSLSNQQTLTTDSQAATPQKIIFV
jgi:hypothetical protein